MKKLNLYLKIAVQKVSFFKIKIIKIKNLIKKDKIIYNIY